MTGEDIVRRVRIVGSAEGVDQASMAVDKLSGSYGKLDQVSEAASRSVVTQSRAVLSTSTAYERLRLSVDPLANAQSKLERATRTATAELERGKITVEEHASTLELAARKFGVAATANDNLTRRIGLQSHEWKNLGFQANDAATMLLSGSSAFQVVASQGGQVLQVLQGAEGGLAGGLRAVGGAAAGLLTPLAAVGGTLTAVVVGSALAYRSFAQGQRTLQDSLTGLGRSSDATVDSVNRMAPAWATAGKVSTAQAREMAATFAATGEIGQEAFGGLIALAARYAKVTGEDLPDATKELAQLFADPARGADELAKRFGGLSDASREVVRRLMAQGDTTAAQRALLTAASQGVRDVTAETNAWSVSIEAVTRAAKEAYEWTGKLVYKQVTGPTPQERAAESEQARRRLQDDADRQKGYPSQGSGSPLLDNPLSRQGADADRRRLDNATGNAEHDSEVARRASQGGYADMISAEAEKASLKARAAIDAMIPTTNDVRQLEEFQTALTQALKVPGKVANEADARATLDIIKQKLEAGGQAAYELRKATQDAFAVAGLLPYQRALAQIEQKYRDLNQAAGTNQAALATNAEAKAREQGTLRQEMIGNSLRDQGFRIDELVSALKVQRDGFGLSTEAAAALAAKAQEDFARSRDRIVGGMDELRSGTSGLITGTFSDLRQGKSPLDTIKNGLGRMLDGYVDRMISKPLTESLLGQAGKPGGGALGDLMSRAGFGSMSGVKLPDPLSQAALSTTASMTVNAGVVTVNGGGAGGIPGVPGSTAQSSGVTPWPVGKVDSLPLGAPGQSGGGSADVVAYIRQAAAARGIDPEQALKVARSEGLNVFNPGAKYDTTGGDNGMSFGPWQLYTGGGLGNAALSKGINVRDPSTWREQTDFALDQAKQGGWGPWHGWKGDPWQGIGRGGQGSPVSSLDGPADQASKSLTSLSDQASEATKGLGSLGSGFETFGAKLEQASFGGGGSGGGGGGGFGGLFRGFGGAGSSAGDGIGMVASDSMALADVPMLFAQGGYTGPGSKYQPAGIVHAGEFVFSQAATSRIGVGALDAWHRSARGYADGGLVDPAGMIPLSMPMTMPANSNTNTNTIHAPQHVTNNFNGGDVQQMHAIARHYAATAVQEHHKQLERHIGSMVRVQHERFG